MSGRQGFGLSFRGGIAALAALVIVAGCTVHPAGEQAERDRAAQEGRRYAGRPEERALPTLSTQASPEDLVRYALLASPELEQRYWEWRAAIEQVPQDGTQPTNLVLFAGTPINHGSIAFDRTTVTVSNDSMADIEWPSKPAAAAQRALDMARAAGWRFQDAKLALRLNVLSAYYDYALAAELVRIEEENVRVLAVIADVAEQGVSSGKSTQAAALNASNDAALAENRLQELRSRLPGLLASANVAIGRRPTEALAPPKDLLDPQPTTRGAADWLAWAAQHNPALAGLDAELRSKADSIVVAKLQSTPDFSLGVGTDLGAMTQNLSGMLTMPMLRHEAIEAAITQADANFRATEAMRRQEDLDLRSRVVADVATLDDLTRQLTFIRDDLLPRATSVLDVTRAEYESGRSSIADTLQAERAMIDLKRLQAGVIGACAQRRLRIDREVGTPMD